MRRGSALALVLVLAWPAAGAAPPPAELKPVAAQALPKSADARLAEALRAHAGKPVLINFWATWCEPCREEMPALARLAERQRPAGLAVLTVAVADNAKRVEDFLWEVLPPGQSLPVLHDREQTLSRAWSARLLPTTLLLDRRHRIVARGLGAIDWDAPVIERQLKPHLKQGEKP